MTDLNPERQGKAGSPPFRSRRPNLNAQPPEIFRTRTRHTRTHSTLATCLENNVMTMSFLTPLPPLFPRLSYQIPIHDIDQDPSYSIIPSILPSQNQNQRNRRNSQDNKYLSDIDREEDALHARVIPFYPHLTAEHKDCHPWTIIPPSTRVRTIRSARILRRSGTAGNASPNRRYIRSRRG
jgi:hypothetical protein